MQIAVPALLGILGVLVGAVLQHFLSRRASSMKAAENLRDLAYTDYLRCVSEIASWEPHEDVNARLADAKVRIAVLGSPDVVEALAELERVGSLIDNPKSAERFSELVTLIRKDSAVLSGTLSRADLNTILFGTKEWE